MSDLTNSQSTAQRYAPWLKLAARISGSTAVVLGGWSLWLAFSSVQQQEQIEALDNWQDEISIAADDLPDVLHPAPRQAAIQITEVVSHSEVEAASGIEHAEFVTQHSGPSDPIEMAGFTTESDAAPEQDVAEKHSTTSAAWLTGEIEDSARDDESPARAAAGIPAWKRTTKSLKAAQRTPPALPRNHSLPRN